MPRRRRRWPAAPAFPAGVLLAALALGALCAVPALAAGRWPESFGLSLQAGGAKHKGSHGAPPPYVPNEIIVRFRDQSAAGAVAQEVFERRQPFEGITGNHDLDTLFQKLDVRSVVRLVRLPGESAAPGVIGAAAAQQRLRANSRRHQERLDSLRKRFSARGGRSGAGGVPRTDAVYRILVPAGRDVVAAAAELARDPEVLYAEPNRLVHLSMVPNDPYYSSSGSWGQTGEDLWGVKRIRPETSWDDYTGDGIVVAVTDTGVYGAHEDLAANLWINPGEIPGNGVDDDVNGYVDDVNGYDFVYRDGDPDDRYGHGTHVAGTIAATGNNGRGIIGVAPEARIMALKVLSDDGVGDNSTIWEAVQYAVDQGARVINASWGGSGRSSLIEDAVQYATANGCAFVCAAGNDNRDARYGYPANIDGAIVVGALDSADRRAPYSNHGGKVDVYAPGGGEMEILSLLAPGSLFETDPSLSPYVVGGRYFRAAGTSMAAPHVAGLAALLMQKTPSLTPEQLRYLLRTEATGLSSSGWNEQTSWGRVDCTNSTNFTGTAAALRSFIAAPALWLPFPDNFVAKGIVPVRGTAAGQDFSRYELHRAPYTPASAPVFSTVHTFFSPVENGALAALDTSGWTPGLYFLRLRVVDTAGLSADSITLVDIDPAAKTGWPRLAASEWLSLPQGASWDVYNCLDPVFDDLDHDGRMEVVALRDGTLFAWRDDGSPLNAGFPVSLSAERGVGASPSVADLDGDGDHEVIIVASAPLGQPMVQAFHHDGSPVAGFPGGIPDPRLPTQVWGLLTIFPALVSDLDDDGEQEIAFIAGTYDWSQGCSKTYLMVLDHQGRMAAGWPVELSSPLADPLFNMAPFSSLAAADLDGDGRKEIVTAMAAAGLRTSLGIYSASGSLLKEIALGTETETAAAAEAESQIEISQVIVADFEGNGSSGIFAAVNVWFPPRLMESRVYLLDSSGIPRPGWPRQVPARSQFGQCFAADLDGDGDLEAAGWGYGEDSDNALVWALNSDGSALAGYPLIIKTRGWAEFWNNRFTVAPLSQANPALFAGNYFKDLYGFAPSGIALPGWPKPVPGTPGAPAVADLDNDGKLEIGFQSVDGFLYLWEEAAFDSLRKLSAWPTYAGDNRRTNTPFIPTLKIESFPAVFPRGETTPIGLRWEDLPSDVHYQIVLKLIDSQAGAVAGRAIVEVFGDEGKTTVSLPVGSAAAEGSTYRLEARCEHRTSFGPPLARTVTADNLRVNARNAEPPPVPRNLRSTAIASSQVDLAWDPANGNVAVQGYEVSRDGTVFPVEGTTFSDTGLAPRTTYHYQVRALDTSGQRSAFSPALPVTTPPPKAAGPAFSVPAGTYGDPQSISITSATPGAAIRYTSDGTAPTATSGILLLNGGTVPVQQTLLLQAVAFQAKWLVSAVTGARYTLQPRAPAFTPEAGTYLPSRTFSIASATAGASIAYTTDGSAPSRSHGAQAKSPVKVILSRSATLQAIAYRAGWSDSEPTSATYTITTNKAATPQFTPRAGTYYAAQAVTLWTPTGGATIRYTTDGSTPSRTLGIEIANGGTVLLESTATLKAFAALDGWAGSSVAAATYLLKPVTPVFIPVAATYRAPQTVRITTATAGAAIRYTTDGTAPTPLTGTEIPNGGSVTLERTAILRAIASCAGWTPSAVKSGGYAMKTAAPGFSPAAGILDSPRMIRIFSPTPGALLWYTTDGAAPTRTRGTALANGDTVRVIAPATLKAIAGVGEGWADSNVATATYTGNSPVESAADDRPMTR